jgi:hypothetical protein
VNGVVVFRPGLLPGLPPGLPPIPSFNPTLQMGLVLAEGFPITTNVKGVTVGGQGFVKNAAHEPRHVYRLTYLGSP